MPQRKPVTIIELAETVFGEFEKFTVAADHRVVIPREFRERLELSKKGDACVLAHESEGCISVWHEPAWRRRLETLTRDYRNEFIGQTDSCQILGRLLAARQVVLIEDGWRILIPARFRKEVIYEDRDGDKAHSHVTMISNGLCLEIWHPNAWHKFLREPQPTLWEIVENLSEPTV